MQNENTAAAIDSLTAETEYEVLHIVPTPTTDPSEQDCDLLAWLEEQDVLNGETFDPEQAARDGYIDHLLALMADLDAEHAADSALAERRIEERTRVIREWAAAQAERYQRRRDYLEQQLRVLAAHVDMRGKRSRTFPHGKVGLRKKQDTLEILDMQAAVAFAERAGLEVKKSVNKTPLLDLLKRTGEIADGCDLVPGGDEIYVTPAAVPVPDAD